jgi:hypothetical protein
MSHAKATAIALLAGLALSLVASSPAFAGGWFVNGTKLAAGAKEAVATTTRMTESMVLNVPSLGIKLSCSRLSEEAPEIIGTTSGKAASSIFEGCSETSPAKCSVEPRIPTLGIFGFTIFIHGIEIFIQRPLTGTTFATIDFAGTECSIAGEKALKGQVVGRVPTGQTELVEQPLEGMGTTENNSLEITGDKAYIEKGKSFNKLANSDKWSFQE